MTGRCVARAAFPSWMVLIGLCLVITALTSAASAQEISAANTSRYVGDRRWEWTVFVQASPETLNGIRCVEYTLHPTFPDPVRRQCALGDLRFPFALTTNGWGTFEIAIKVLFKDGRERALKHMLVFAAPPVERPLPIQTANVATEARKGLWEWTVFVQAPDSVLEQIRCVEYTLHPTFPDRVREVCDRGPSRQPFALTARGWGIFEIQVRVFLKDGHVQTLTHSLKF
jgi:transcription initiation factor IIF auxiliary subunit